MSAEKETSGAVGVTPGSWAVWECGEGLDSAQIFAGSLGSGQAKVVADLFPREDETASGAELKANAHLIAAAPDLYEALEELLAASLTNITLRESAARRSLARDAARCALKKARGEAK